MSRSARDELEQLEATSLEVHRELAQLQHKVRLANRRAFDAVSQAEWVSHRLADASERNLRLKRGSQAFDNPTLRAVVTRLLLALVASVAIATLLHIAVVLLGGR